MIQKPANHDNGVPVSQAILAKTTVFTSYSKKNPFGQKTQLLEGFAKRKSFHSENTQVWAAFEKNDAIGNKTENSRVPS